jgi:hypothetical protein
MMCRGYRRALMCWGELAPEQALVGEKLGLGFLGNLTGKIEWRIQGKALN